LKNRISTVETCSELHRHYNQAGGKESGLRYDEFLAAAINMGVLGVVEKKTERYTLGDFSYTFPETLAPLEGKDSVCVHPLFMYQLFDPNRIHELREDPKVKPVYPFGTDVDESDLAL